MIGIISFCCQQPPDPSIIMSKVWCRMKPLNRWFIQIFLRIQINIVQTFTTCKISTFYTLSAVSLDLSIDIYQNCCTTYKSDFLFRPKKVFKFHNSNKLQVRNAFIIKTKVTRYILLRAERQENREEEISRRCISSLDGLNISIQISILSSTARGGEQSRQRVCSEV